MPSIGENQMRSWPKMVVVLLVILIFSQYSFGQTKSTQASTPTESAEGLQRFVLEWYPLISVVAIIVVCVLLQEIAVKISKIPAQHRAEMDGINTTLREIRDALSKEKA
jgi:hypothetical protein